MCIKGFILGSDWLQSDPKTSSTSWKQSTKRKTKPTRICPVLEKTYQCSHGTDHNATLRGAREIRHIHWNCAIRVIRLMDRIVMIDLIWFDSNSHARSANVDWAPRKSINPGSEYYRMDWNRLCIPIYEYKWGATQIVLYMGGFQSGVEGREKMKDFWLWRTELQSF